MKGLLYKNMLLIVRQFKRLLILSLLFLVMGVIPGKGQFWAVYAIVMLSMFAVSVLQSDETTKWNQYCDVLPLSRKEIVTSYYAGTYLLLAMEIVLYVIIAAIARAFTGGSDEVLLTALVMTVVSFLFSAMSIPLILIFGSQRASVVRLILIAMVVAVGLLTGGGEEITGGISGMQPAGLAGAAIFLTVASAVVSWLISVRVYERKELS